MKFCETELFSVPYEYNAAYNEKTVRDFKISQNYILTDSR